MVCLQCFVLCVFVVKFDWFAVCAALNSNTVLAVFFEVLLLCLVMCSCVLLSSLIGVLFKCFLIGDTVFVGLCLKYCCSDYVCARVLNVFCHLFVNMLLWFNVVFVVFLGHVLLSVCFFFFF